MKIFSEPNQYFIPFKYSKDLEDGVIVSIVPKLPRVEVPLLSNSELSGGGGNILRHYHHYCGDIYSATGHFPYPGLSPSHE